MRILDQLRDVFGQRKAVAQNNLGEMVKAVADGKAVDDSKLATLLSAPVVTSYIPITSMSRYVFVLVPVYITLAHLGRFSLMVAEVEFPREEN